MGILEVIGLILTLLGSLGLFLFGMKLMSESLMKVAGSRMRNFLSSITSNPFKGIFTGFLVTSGIQSSSATTVMIVSFVNAGLLSLTAAIGVIMGANIGTTVTAWLVALLGFKFNINLIAIPIIGLAFPLLFSKRGTLKSWGEFVIGFSLLFIGLSFLKENIPVVTVESGIVSFIYNYTDFGFFSVIIFFLFGALITIAIQSSSATMALTIVMCSSGWISFEMAAAMVLGENLGTTITANLAALVANKVGKRAARAHFIFNIIGAIWLLIIFYPYLKGIDWLTTQITGLSAETSKDSVPIGLALFHSIFNIANTLILVSFIPGIIKITKWLVPEEDDEDKTFRLKYINSSLLSTSELSIIQARKEIVHYGQFAKKMFDYIPLLLMEKNLKKYSNTLNKVKKYEQISDNIEIEIATYLTKLSESELSNSGSQRVRAMLKIIDDIESICDHIKQMALNIESKNERKLWFTQEIRENLSRMFNLLNDAFSVMIENLDNDYKNANLDKAKNIEQEINSYRDKLRDEYYSVKEKEYTYEAGVSYSSLYATLERIGDYIINVSEAINDSNPKQIQ